MSFHPVTIPRRSYSRNGKAPGPLCVVPLKEESYRDLPDVLWQWMYLSKDKYTIMYVIMSNTSVVLHFIHKIPENVPSLHPFKVDYIR